MSLAAGRSDRFWSMAMMDSVMMSISLAFFALSIVYVYACDRL